MYIAGPTASAQLSRKKVNTTSRALFASADGDTAGRSRPQALLATAMVSLSPNPFSGDQTPAVARSRGGLVSYTVTIRSRGRAQYATISGSR
jgi:hypothetical protein